MCRMLKVLSSVPLPRGDNKILVEQRPASEELVDRLELAGHIRETGEVLDRFGEPEGQHSHLVSPDRLWIGEVETRGNGDRIVLDQEFFPLWRAPMGWFEGDVRNKDQGIDSVFGEILLKGKDQPVVELLSVRQKLV